MIDAIVPARCQDIDARVGWIREFLTPSLPRGWRCVETRPDGAHWVGPERFSVIVSGDVRSDGKRWLHVSCARPNCMPTWQDVRWMKERFIGTGRYAIQVFPPRDVYVNIHPFALHLWHCVDGWPLPEFSGLVAGARSI